MPDNAQLPPPGPFLGRSRRRFRRMPRIISLGLIACTLLATPLLFLSWNVANSGNPAWSPDGTKIAFETNLAGNWEIYTINVDGSGLQNVSNTPDSIEGWPAWSPDGAKIAFQSNRDGNWEIYVMNLDGSGLKRLTDNSSIDGLPTWSPNGRSIAFVSNQGGSWGVWVMNADGSGQSLPLQVEVIDDAYNANPASLGAALEVLGCDQREAHDASPSRACINASASS